MQLGLPGCSLTHYIEHQVEFDEVHIAEDLNQSVRKITSAQSFNPSAISDVDREALNIYYVACTRARINLINATEL